MNIYYDFEYNENIEYYNRYRYRYKSKDLNIIDYDKITNLNCEYNKLIEFPIFPILPKYLELLACYYNNLKYLPKLPNCLIRLDCENNKLIELPILPKKLECLYCY